MSRARQLRAIGQLSWRSLTRRALRNGAPEIGAGAATKRLLLLGYAALVNVYIFGRAAYGISQLRHGRVTATSLFLFAWMLFALTLVANCEAAPLRQRLAVGFLNPAILDPLPISLINRLFVQLYQAGALGGLVLFFYCMAPERFWTQWPALTALALAFLLATVLAAKAVSLTLLVGLRPSWARRSLNVVVGATAVAGLVLLWAALFPRWIVGIGSRLTVFVPPFRPLAQLLASRRGASYGFNFLVLGLVGSASWALIALLERVGYDRGLGATSHKHTRTRARLDPDGVERLLLRRQQAAVLWWSFVALAFGGSLWLARELMASDSSPGTLRLAHMLPFGVAEFACLYALAQAQAQAHRERQARPLLASLPLSPADTLASKTRALQLLILPLLLVLIPPLIASHFESELLWKSGVVAVGIWLVDGAAVPIAFLNAGAGSNDWSGAGLLDQLLILLPLFAALAAPTPLTELPSLGALALVAWEARRAAALHVRWLDDAGDDLERETPVWRALLVFAVFVGLEALTALVLSWTSTGLALAIAYAVSASALVLLTLNGREGLVPMLWLGARRWLLPLGVVLGGGAGLVAIAYAKVIDRFGLDPGPLASAYEAATPMVKVALAAVAIAAAPLAEEMFFRGWLQPAIRVELPARWKRCAFVLAAFAFAAIHPGAAFPVVFLLGLVAGLLYELTGGVVAGILAHAAYNAVVTFVRL